MIAMPDPSTFAILPWRPAENATGRMFCDVRVPGGDPYEGDPRWILRRALKRAEDMGFDAYNIGPELEYFYFRSAKPAGRPAGDPRRGRLLRPHDARCGLRRPARDDPGARAARHPRRVRAPRGRPVPARGRHALQGRALDVGRLHDVPHRGQGVRDEVRLARDVHAEAAVRRERLGHARPPVARRATAGTRSSTPTTSTTSRRPRRRSSPASSSTRARSRRCSPSGSTPTSGSCPATRRPTYLAWSRRNRSALIRVPLYHPGKEQATRAELRCPDPACNPYLCFAGMLHAGLEGIEKGYELPEPMEQNLYHLTPEEREKRGIEELPETLGEAIEIAAHSELVLRILGEHTFNRFIEIKRAGVGGVPGPGDSVGDRQVPPGPLMSRAYGELRSPGTHPHRPGPAGDPVGDHRHLGPAVPARVLPRLPRARQALGLGAPPLQRAPAARLRGRQPHDHARAARGGGRSASGGSCRWPWSPSSSGRSRTSSTTSRPPAHYSTSDNIWSLGGFVVEMAIAVGVWWLTVRNPRRHQPRSAPLFQR